MVEGSVTEDFQKRSVIHSNSEVFAAKDEVSCLVQGIGNGQSFTLNWAIPELRRVRESAAYQGDLPSLFAAEEVIGGTGAVLLK